MKVRAGFVSNSSSSSFCIYGTKYILPDEVTSEDIDEKIHQSDIDLEYHCGSYWGESSVYIGRSWNSVKDSETGKQFKESIEANIKKLLPDETDIKFRTFEEAWSDG